MNQLEDSPKKFLERSLEKCYLGRDPRCFHLIPHSYGREDGLTDKHEIHEAFGRIMGTEEFRKRINKQVIEITRPKRGRPIKSILSI